jgi:CTD small phosphatase-like protein 2
VLDLDETLVHSSTADEGLAYDLAFDVPFGAVTHRVRVLKRPHVDEFLKRVSQLFEIVGAPPRRARALCWLAHRLPRISLAVFTASDRAYADRLLTLLDPQRRISHRVFRDSCTQFEGSYLKDLRVLGRDLAQTAIVDNSPEAFGLQIANGIPIESWLDDPSDTELLKLLPFLESMASAHDVRPLLRKRFNLHELVYGAKGALRR